MTNPDPSPATDTWQVPEQAPAKSLLHAYLLLVLLGFFGGHRFYLRRWFSGVLYLLSFGCLGLGLALDLLLLPWLVQRSNAKLAKQFAADPQRFARRVPRRAPWAGDEGIGAKLELVLVLGFWAVAPAALAMAGFMIGKLEVLLIVAAILLVTSHLQWAGDLFRRHPRLLDTPIVGGVLRELRKLEGFYFEHRPRAFLYYLFYPLVTPFALLFSKTARRELWLFLKPIALISAVLLVDVVTSWTEITPYIPLSMALLTVCATIVLLLIPLVGLLLPAMVSAISLSHRGRVRTSRALLLVSLPLALAFGAAGWAVTRDKITLPANLWLMERMRSPELLSALRATSTMFLRYHRPLEVDDTGLDEARTEELQRLLDGLLGPTEPFAFQVWRATDDQGSWLCVVLASGDTELLFAIGAEGDVRSGLDAFPDGLPAALSELPVLELEAGLFDERYGWLEDAGS